VATDRTLTGRTDTTDDRFLATASLFHVLGSIDSGFDQRGDNHSRTSWTITGTRAGGRTFTLTRSNRWADRFDTSFGPAFELAVAEDTLLANEFEPVRIRDVSYRIDLSPNFDQETVVRRLVAVNGGALRERDRVAVRPGDRLRVRTVLRPYRKSTTHTVDQTLTVPAGTPRGELSLAVLAGNTVFGDDLGGDGGAGGVSCLLQPGGGCARDQAAAAADQSFDTLLDDLRSTPQNNQLSAVLSQLDEDGTPSATISSSTRLLRRVVTGFVDPIAVVVR
jgi:hypothetical protein